MVVRGMFKNPLGTLVYSVPEFGQGRLEYQTK